jgi:hypothetical protein
MTSPDSEERRATGAWTLEGTGADGSGEGQLLVTDDAVSVGPRSVEFLDVDEVRDEERVLTLSLWPKGTLRLSLLARRHETFSRVLREARGRARLAGLLAHGIDAPVPFNGAVREPGPEREARLLIYRTHLAVIPSTGDPWQIPLGGVSSIQFVESDWNVVVEAAGKTVVFGRLARMTEAFARELTAVRQAQGLRLSEATGAPGFADGVALGIPDEREFDRLVSSFAAPERVEGAARIVAAAGREKVRLGFVELLDPDAEGLAPKMPLPANVAFFLLAQFGNRTLLELLSGPAAATYLFEAQLADVASDLCELHYRRRPLALTEAETTGPAGRPYRLAFRRLAPLQRLRAATRARLVHSESWGAALEKAISPG